MAKTSISHNTKELDSLRRDICRKVGITKSVLISQDFSFLESNINRMLPNAQIEQKKLKRIFGYDKTDPTLTIRRYTVDILASYVGENDWENYIENLSKEANNSGDFVGNSQEINAFLQVLGIDFGFSVEDFT